MSYHAPTEAEQTAIVLSESAKYSKHDRIVALASLMMSRELGHKVGFAPGIAADRQMISETDCFAGSVQIQNATQYTISRWTTILNHEDYEALPEPLGWKVVGKFVGERLRARYVRTADNPYGYLSPGFPITYMEDTIDN